MSRRLLPLSYGPEPVYRDTFSVASLGPNGLGRPIETADFRAQLGCPSLQKRAKLPTPRRMSQLA
jgi:hypothetical protein